MTNLYTQMPLNPKQQQNKHVTENIMNSDR